MITICTCIYRSRVGISLQIIWSCSFSTFVQFAATCKFFILLKVEHFDVPYFELELIDGVHNVLSFFNLN